MARVRILDDGTPHYHWHGIRPNTIAEIVDPNPIFGSLLCAGEGEFARLDGDNAQSVPIESMKAVDAEARAVLDAARKVMETHERAYSPAIGAETWA